MMKMVIADDEPLARNRLRALLDELGMGSVVAEATNGRDVLHVVRIHQPDVVLLDIRMPGIDGMQAAKQIALLYPAPVVIFTTAYAEHALEAFEYQAIDYLLKPIRKERLEQAIKRAHTFIQSKSVPQPALPITTPAARTHISYYLRGEVHIVAVDQVYYFFAHQKYVVLHWTGGEILITDVLKDLEKEFAGQFLRIHRSTLVAMVQIVKLVKLGKRHYQIYLKDVEQPLEVSRRHLQTVKKVLKDMRIPCYQTVVNDIVVND